MFKAEYYAHMAELPDGKQTASNERAASSRALSSCLKTLPQKVAYAR
jgi:hypothetical protein